MLNPPRRALRVFIWGSVAFQGVIMAALVVLIFRTAGSLHDSPATVISALVGTLALVIFPAVGALIFSRRPGHPIGWLFCLSQLGWSLNNFANGFGTYALRVRPDLLPVARWLAWFYTWPGFLSTALFLFLVLFFPDGALPSPRWRPAAWTVVIWAVVVTLTSAFTPGPVDTSGALPFINPLGMGGPVGRVLTAVSGFAQVSLAPLFVLAALSLVLRFRSARGQTRQQLKWLAVSIVFAALAVLIAMVLWITFPTAATTPLWAVALEQLAIFSLSLIPVSAGIAILRYHLYEIDRIINQALVYSSLTIALALVYFGCVLILQTVLGAITGEGQSTIATVLSTLAIASLFIPLRRRIQSLIDRRFYRQKYNAEIILGRLSGVLRSEVDLQVMSDQLVSVVEEALQPQKANLWLTRRNEGGK